MRSLLNSLAIVLFVWYVYFAYSKFEINDLSQQRVANPYMYENSLKSIYNKLFLTKVGPNRSVIEEFYKGEVQDTVWLIKTTEYEVRTNPQNCGLVLLYGKLAGDTEIYASSLENCANYYPKNQNIALSLLEYYYRMNLREKTFEQLNKAIEFKSKKRYRVVSRKMKVSSNKVH